VILDDFFLPKIPVFYEVWYELYHRDYKHEFSLNNAIYEGLIKTYPRQDLKAYIQSKLRLSVQPDSVDVNNIIIQVTEKQIYNINRLLKLIQQYGWYISGIELGTIINGRQLGYDFNGSDVDINEYIETITKHGGRSLITIEPKYSDEVKTPTLIYHTTLNSIWANKISKIGLSPKSQSILSTHPDRVYYMNNIEGAEQFGVVLAREKLQAAKSKTYNSTKFNPVDFYKHWVVLEIDTTKIPNARGLSYFRVHMDPNAPNDKYNKAVYSVNSVPPDAITMVKQFNAY